MPAGLSPLLDLVRIGLALLAGSLAGSLPIAAWVGRAAGMDAGQEGEGNAGVAEVWSHAGPGWGLLALTGDLARGILPVAVAIVTFGWWTGWATAVGVVAGAGWPAVGHWRGRPGVAALAGACLALAPAAGVLGLAAAAIVAAVGSVAGRRARVAAIGAGFGAYAVLFLLVHPDLARFVGLGVVLALGLVRAGRTRSQSEFA